jgi:primosomal protein N' (replication factor Y)
MWAAAERVGPDGQLVIQTSTPDHYAVRAIAKQDLAEFYGHEVRFRAEVGYPPFRRLCRLRVRGRTEDDARAMAAALSARLGEAGLTVYPPLPGARRLVWTILAKGGQESPSIVRSALETWAGGRRSRARMVEVELDPVD